VISIDRCVEQVLAKTMNHIEMQSHTHTHTHENMTSSDHYQYNIIYEHKQNDYTCKHTQVHAIKLNNYLKLTAPVAGIGF